MASGNEIPALLLGVAELIRPAAPSAEAVKVRPGPDGRPLAAYRGGGWHYGVYWPGMSGAWGPSHEAYEVTFTVGIDITRVWAKSPTKDVGEWFLQEGELYERMGYVSQLILRGNSQAARACQAALSVLDKGDPAGLFREHFDSVQCRGVRTEDPVSWLLAKDTDAHVCYVGSLVFSGLTYHKKYEELPT